MKRLFLCAAILFSLSGIAKADDSNLEHVVVGVGMKPCSFYVENINDTATKLIIYSWVQGVITGMDKIMVVAGKKEFLIKKVQTSDVVTSTFDNICRSNPDKTIDGVTELTYSALLQQ